MPLKVAVDKKMLGFFFRPTKKMSVFRTRLSRANCLRASASPPKREANWRGGAGVAFRYAPIALLRKA